MALEWTAEQNTLDSIKRIIDKAWRMNSQQLHSCCRRLRQKQQELLPGRLGSAFLVHLEQMADRESGAASAKEWPELLRDTGRLIQLINRYGQLGREEWLCVLSKLEAHQDKYFKTELGLMFILTLKEKLGLAEPESEMSKAELERLAAWLMQDKDAQCIFKSTKELLQHQKKKKTGHWVQNLKNSLYYGKNENSQDPLFSERMNNSAVFIFASLSVCFMTVWLFGQIARNQSTWGAQEMRVSASQKADIVTGERTLGASNKNSQSHVSQDIPENANRQEDLSAVREDSKILKQSEGNAERVKRPKIQKQFQNMAAEYPGLFGWLQIPGTQIDLPVMQPFKEKEYYLDHDFTGADSAEGALFTDPGNSCWPQDGNTVIYGHNMKNGHMFGTLDLYEDADYFQSHREIHFDTIYETGVYEAVAVIKTRILNENEPGFRYYQFFRYDSEEEFQECLDFIKANQLFDTDSKLKYGDCMLMLSTCEYSQENGRLVIVARKM